MRAGLATPVAYLGFHLGGVQNFSGKVGVFAWREAPCSAWRSHAFARGVQGCDFGVFWSTVSVNILLRKYYNYLNNI